MKLPDLQGSPKQVNWASRIRQDRLKVWQESSPEMYKEVERTLVSVTDAGWWISYKDKDITTVCNHFLHGVDLQKLQRDQWRKQEKKQEQKDSAEVRAYLKRELEVGRKVDSKQVSKVTLRRSMGDGLVRFEGLAIDTRTGEVSCDPDLPF